ncbi:MAG: NAD(P)/FAD-dependent oxidoreductase [Polyangiales bacterium]
MSDVDTVVIGAGVVGLACAASLATRGDSVLVLERNALPGQETSSRNSGVIHAGLYYPRDSLKARLCARGRDMLYARAATRGISHKRLGKLVIATEQAELPKLEALAATAQANGVPELRMLERAEVARLEPHVRAQAALFSPVTGIVDAHELGSDYRAQALAHGALLALRTRVLGVERSGERYRLATIQEPNGDRLDITASAVVNAAGLEATNIAASVGLPVAELGYVQQLCKGDYFQVAPRIARLLTHLVYPMPVHAGLGVHLTFDTGGQLRAGPDTQYIDTPQYDVDPGKRALFFAAVSRYLPAVREEDFTPDYAGLRPKLQGPGDPFRDFVIEEATTYGLPRFVNLLGIESPGLTASEAIGQYVRDLLPI